MFDMCMDAREVKVLRHGGAEVLRIYTPCIVGECAAAVHLRALCTALFDYASRELYPVAAGELERAVRERGRFLPRRYEVSVRIGEHVRCVTLELSVLYTQAGRELFSYRLPTYWTKDGSVQRRGERHMRRSKRGNTGGG